MNPSILSSTSKFFFFALRQSPPLWMTWNRKEATPTIWYKEDALWADCFSFFWLFLFLFFLSHLPFVKHFRSKCKATELSELANFWWKATWDALSAQSGEEYAFFFFFFFCKCQQERSLHLRRHSANTTCKTRRAKPLWTLLRFSARAPVL